MTNNKTLKNVLIFHIPFHFMLPHFYRFVVEICNSEQTYISFKKYFLLFSNFSCVLSSLVFVFKIGKSEEPRLVCVCFLLAAKEKASAWLFNQSNTFTEDEKECKGLGRDQHMYKTEVGMIWGDNIETELKE